SAGLVVLRPTHYPRSHFHGVIATVVPVAGKPVERFLGRNVSFKELITTAYGQNAGRVTLPWDAPKTNFDFLVTVSERQQERLQEAIRKQFGFVARQESRETEVLAVRVANAQLPGLSISGADTKESVEFKEERLWFRHVRVSALNSGLEGALGQPVVDKTGLTNVYDFSLAWDPQVRDELQNGATARAAADKLLNGFGLALTPDRATLDVLVVKRGE
ncbi:MAG TPA: TIGR03435 family protein, partial [Candidatus Sulfotelmatobacter sp.]|nr:TIGR03435 family protein [Candidatus Sulfotelmatobacter sp.]